MLGSLTLSELVRPDLPKPRCRVMLVCGPPAAGKTTFVRKHAGAQDLIIDLDAIANSQGKRNICTALQARNRMLAALASEPPERVAWVIICAPAPSLRQWWANALDAEIILLLPTRAELYQRIVSTRDRAELKLVDKWFTRERADNPGVLKSGCDASGYPTDPLHPWNRQHER